MITPNYEDTQSLQNWLETCQQFPDKIGDFDANIEYDLVGNQRLDDEEIDRLLKEAGLVKANQISPEGKIKLVREQKCLLGLRGLKTRPCGIECPAPWQDPSASFLFVYKNPSLASSVRNCNEDTYALISGSTFPDEKTWKQQQETKMVKDLKQFALLEKDVKRNYDAGMAAAKKMRTFTKAQKEAKRKAEAKLHEDWQKQLAQITAAQREFRERKLPDYKSAKKSFWENGCANALAQYRANLTNAQKSYSECEARIARGQLLPADFERVERKIRESTEASIKNQEEVLHRPLTSQERSAIVRDAQIRIRDFQSLRNKKLNAEQKQSVQQYFKGIKRKLDRQQVIKEHCMIKARQCFPEDEYKTLENWSSMNDLRNVLDLLNTRCPAMIESALRGHDYKSMLR